MSDETEDALHEALLAVVALFKRGGGSNEGVVYFGAIEIERIKSALDKYEALKQRRKT